MMSDKNDGTAIRATRHETPATDFSQDHHNDEPKSKVNAIKSAIKYHSIQVPTPEPRRNKPSHQNSHNPLAKKSGLDVKLSNKSHHNDKSVELDSDDFNPGVKLVHVRSRRSDDDDDSEAACDNTYKYHTQHVTISHSPQPPRRPPPPPPPAQARPPQPPIRTSNPSYCPPQRPTESETNFRQPPIIKRTSFNDVPTDFLCDEGMGGPNTDINDYNDNVDEVGDETVCGEHQNEEEDEEYYEDDDEDFDLSQENREDLKNLSRQSMVPLHELIAYYRYIQQGSNQAELRNDPVSRQSSSASQQTTRTNYSNTDDSADSSRHSNLNHVIQNQISKLRHVGENPLSRAGQKTNITESNRDAGFEGQSIVESRVTKVQSAKIPAEDEPSKLSQADDVTADQFQQQVDVGEECDEESMQNRVNDDHQNQLKIVANQENQRRIRANVVLELINSERDFVKHLKDVVEGYLYPARRHPEIFTGERINTIFSNIEQLYEFQKKFLESLENCINWEDLAQSQVGICFLEYEKGFSVYHHYCNNHPNATSELQDLYTKPRFVKFFEACRLLQNMIDISLDGFLLTPIQKICKYPLQLNELLKNTDQSHPDYQNVTDALESMRNCANLANERKRRIEALADVMSFQEKVDNWFGPKLSDTSSILIHSGEVSKMTSHTWSQGVQLYLFDHLLLYSKKDLLKRNSLILKGRICMDTVTEISDADEYKPKKSFKIYCGEQQKWFIFTTRSEKERDEWIGAFERERNLVEADEHEGFHITEREIGVARRALQNRKHSRSARYRHKRPDTTIVDQLDLDDANLIMNRTLSLPSCIHPSHVLNFVEDSKVLSASRKKNASPNSSSRSPVSNAQQQQSQLYFGSPESQGPVNQALGASSWFKKMGSKKLAKSQVYNINGSSGVSSGGGGSAGKVGVSRTTSPTVSSITTTAAASSIIMDTSGADKYDQLEKRHRDHMVSEEQARLYRLNNDLAPPIFASATSTTSPLPSAGQMHANSKLSPPIQSAYRSQHITTDSNSDSPGQTSQLMTNTNRHRDSLQPQSEAQSLDSSLQRSLNISQDSPRGSQVDQFGGNSTESTFETTVVLSSGRIVRVREDAV